MVKNTFLFRFIIFQMTIVINYKYCAEEIIRKNNYGEASVKAQECLRTLFTHVS